jgi:hypothetical protein
MIVFDNTVGEVVVPYLQYLQIQRFRKHYHGVVNFYDEDCPEPRFTFDLNESIVTFDLVRVADVPGYKPRGLRLFFERSEAEATQSKSKPGTMRLENGQDVPYHWEIQECPPNTVGKIHFQQEIDLGDMDYPDYWVTTEGVHVNCACERCSSLKVPRGLTSVSASEKEKA